MTKKLLVILFLVVCLIVPSNAQGQSSPEELETQKRLNEIEAKRATQSATTSAKKQTGEISFVEGAITSATNPILIVSTNSGNKIVYTTDSTKFLNLDSKGKKLIGFGDLKLGEKILLIGLPKGSASGTAKIIVRDQNPKTKNFSFLGKVLETSESSITLNNFNQKELPATKINIAQDTIIKKSNKDIKISELKVQDKVVLTGNIDEKGTLMATFVQSF